MADILLPFHAVVEPGEKANERKLNGVAAFGRRARFTVCVAGYFLSIDPAILPLRHSSYFQERTRKICNRVMTALRIREEFSKESLAVFTIMINEAKYGHKFSHFTHFYA